MLKISIPKNSVGIALSVSAAIVFTVIGVVVFEYNLKSMAKDEALSLFQDLRTNVQISGDMARDEAKTMSNKLRNNNLKLETIRTDATEVDKLVNVAYERDARKNLEALRNERFDPDKARHYRAEFVRTQKESGQGFDYYRVTLTSLRHMVAVSFLGAAGRESTMFSADEFAAANITPIKVVEYQRLPDYRPQTPAKPRAAKPTLRRSSYTVASR